MNKAFLALATAAILYENLGFAQSSQAQPEQQHETQPISNQSQSESPQPAQAESRAHESNDNRQTTQQDAQRCVGPVSFCNLYFGS